IAGLTRQKLPAWVNPEVEGKRRASEEGERRSRWGCCPLHDSWTQWRGWEGTRTAAAKADAAITEILGFIEKLFGIVDAPRLQVILKDPPVPDRPGNEVFADKVDAGEFVPRRGNVLHDLKRFIAV